jgi:hypothetical protein
MLIREAQSHNAIVYSNSPRGKTILWLRRTCPFRGLVACGQRRRRIDGFPLTIRYQPNLVALPAADDHNNAPAPQNSAIRSRTSRAAERAQPAWSVSLAAIAHTRLSLSFGGHAASQVFPRSVMQTNRDLYTFVRDLFPDGPRTPTRSLEEYLRALWALAQNQVGVHRASDAPADDAARKHIDDEHAAFIGFYTFSRTTMLVAHRPHMGQQSAGDR